MELTEFLACTSLTDTKWTTALDLSLLQIALCLGVAGTCQEGPFLVPWSKMNSGSCTGIWEWAAPGWHLGLLWTQISVASSPALLYYHCELNTNM